MKNNSNKLRVLIVGGYSLDPSQIRGGVKAATSYLVNGLARIEDLELHVLTWRIPGWMGEELININGVSVHLLSHYPRFERLRGYRTYQAALNERLAQIQPHIIHAQEAASDAYVSLRSGYPTVVTAHGIRNEDRKYCHSLNQRIRFYFDSVLTEMYVVSHTRYLIAISHYVTKYFASRFRPDLRCFFIPNAVDERFFKLNKDTHEAVVLFAGRVTPLKRVLDLVQAFDRVVRLIPAAQLRIAGECITDSDYVESIREYVRDAGLENNVHLLGELDQEKILQEYADCSLLVLPSAQENTPLVIAQAMAAGMPVVATWVGGVAEMLGTDGERGLLVPMGDINGLAEAIIKLLHDDTLRQRIGEAGRQFSIENYHPHRVSERTVEVYREIIAREGLQNG